MLMYASTDTPDAPRDLKIDKYDKFSVTLSWKKPENDGGNPIKGKHFNFSVDFFIYHFYLIAYIVIYDNVANDY